MRFDIYRSIIPVYLKGGDGEGDGIGTAAVHRQLQDQAHADARIRELLGLRQGAARPLRNVTVELWLGISTDEAIRMRTSRDRWMSEPLPSHRGGDVQA